MRRPRRYCPAVHADICSICCGNEREVSLNCPLECEYLQEARKHERPRELRSEDLPNQDIHVTEKFLREHEELLMFMAHSLLDAALQTPGAVDSDTRDALESLIRTYRTLQSGLVYETRPTNMVAAVLHERMQAAVQEFRRQFTENTGLSTLRDAEILGVLAFLQRMEIKQANGRPRGRAFLDHLRGYFAGEPAPEIRPLIQQ
ncbi:MAG TPA: hypothetical protein VKV15_24500 [Bryobacteraceae bacterium]|nr:hypothetical protein [Bryobacteraceae bacterium]